MTIICAQNNTPVLMMRIMFDGTEDELDAAIAPLLALPGAGSPPNYPLKRQGSYAEINHALLEEPFGIPQLPPNTPLGEDKQSQYIAQGQLLALSDWQSVVNYYMTTPNIYNTLVIEPYGGTINNNGGNAFIHRQVDMDFFVDVFWDITTGDEAGAKQWLDGFVNLMQPFANGESYQNYPRRSLPNYAQQYWGNAYPTLQQVKQKYDPNNVFNFEQSIQLPQQAYDVHADRHQGGCGAETADRPRQGRLARHGRTAAAGGRKY